MISNRMRTKLLAVAGTAVLCAATAFAQMGAPAQQTPGAGQQPSTPGSNSQPGMTPMGQTDPNMPGSMMDHSMMDKAFVKKALEGGMAEVQLGQLALQKSQSDDVKKFAQKMVDDHSQMGDQMKLVAAKVDVKVPDGPSKKDKALMAKLQTLSGRDFDKAYVKAMVKDHQQDQKDFKDEAQMATIPEVKDIAAKGFQVISMHLQMIQQIAQNTGGVASAK